ncbi:AbiTii domain-containing protein [Providencia rettgeri]
MSLLLEIQRDAIDENVSISSLLRKCLFLASKTGSEQFKKWVLAELNGYASDDKIPKYRVISCQSKGDFSRPGGILQNLVIDIEQLGEDFYDLYGEFDVAISVASIESLVLSAKNDGGMLIQRPWDPAMTKLVSSMIYENMNCIRAWSESPAPLFVGILDQVKTTVLNFALDLEDKLPNIEDIKLSKQDEKIVTQTFNNNIYGNANVANASENFSQNLKVQSNELIDKLISELIQIKNQGVDADVIDKVIPNLESMKGIKDKSIIMEKLVDIMTIAGGAASVSSAIMPYIEPIKKLFL